MGQKLYFLDGCFLGASYYVLAAAEGSTQEAPIITY